MELLRRTRSVCPRCLKNIPAALVREGDAVYMEKTCPDHGAHRCILWRGLVDFDAWRGGIPPLAEGEGDACAERCAACGAHPQSACCVVLEVTRRCNLRCCFCFAAGDAAEPTLEALCAAADDIFSRGRPLLQLSGGEPTLRDDLPELVRHIRESGGRYIQLNTNGIRLAEDPAYVRALAAAGLNIVFLQFDGTEDSVYETLRGRPLLDVKYRAIEACGRAGLGVTLVPTVVRGVNDLNIGSIIEEAVFLSPVVRGVHFQPVSYFGRIPGLPEGDSRFTLDELIAALEQQAGIPAEAIVPSRCDHPACGLHGDFTVTEDMTLLPRSRRDAGETCTSAARNREFIGTRWSGPGPSEAAAADDFDAFVAKMTRKNFTVTAMAFQDAGNLDVERLRRCSLHVYESGALLPFCARYLTPLEVE